MEKRLKNARTALCLSREYVARQLGITPARLAAIESGSTEPSQGELAGFSRLYGIPADVLRHGGQPIKLPEAFEKLTEHDRAEARALIRLRQALKVHRMEGVV